MEHVNLPFGQTGDMSIPKASYITLPMRAVKGLAEWPDVVSRDAPAGCIARRLVAGCA
jgi:hypothetical protein